MNADRKQGHSDHPSPCRHPGWSRARALLVRIVRLNFDSGLTLGRLKTGGWYQRLFGPLGDACGQRVIFNLGHSR